jgi:hypothetical protein
VGEEKEVSQQGEFEVPFLQGFASISQGGTHVGVDPFRGPWLVLLHFAVLLVVDLLVLLSLLLLLLLKVLPEGRADHLDELLIQSLGHILQD